jgi:hypothetical protein
MTFQARLRKCMDRGNLTVADLARWFDRPHPTMRSWVENGVEPAGGPLDAAMAQATLDKLEKMIAKNSKFPVPRLSPQKRIAYLKELRAIATG